MPIIEAKPKMVLVSAAALIDTDGRVLLTKRPTGKSMAGLWEFPGGKIEGGESYEQCLSRELKEELSICVVIDSLYMKYEHSYDSFSIKLISLICRFGSGEIKLTDHDKFSWAIPADFSHYNFVEADIRLAAKIMKDDTFMGS